MKKALTFAFVLVLMISFAGCKKKEQTPQLPAGHPGMEGAGGAPKVDRAVVIPKEVAAKWPAVTLVIEDKAAKKAKEYKVNVGSELAIPDTNMKVKVLAFAPEFQMSDKEITSKSNEPKMPAAQILVSEAGAEMWKGWIFSLQPDMHPFTHDKIGIRLAGGVSR